MFQIRGICFWVKVFGWHGEYKDFNNVAYVVPFCQNVRKEQDKQTLLKYCGKNLTMPYKFSAIGCCMKIVEEKSHKFLPQNLKDLFLKNKEIRADTVCMYVTCQICHNREIEIFQNPQIYLDFTEWLMRLPCFCCSLVINRWRDSFTAVCVPNVLNLCFVNVPGMYDFE